MASPAFRAALAGAEVSALAHQGDGAVFWLGKTLTLARGTGGRSAEQVCQFIDGLLRQGQFARALSILKASKLLEAHLGCLYRGALCMMGMHDWIAVRDLLGDSTSEELRNTVADAQERIVLLSGISYLRGVAQHSLQNVKQAAELYCEAVRINPLNAQAINTLAKYHLLTPTEERDLIIQARKRCSELGHDHALIGSLYTVTFSKYIATPDLDNAFSHLNDAGLGADIDVRAAYAEALYYRYQYLDALEITSAILEHDEYHQRCLLVHLAALFELGRVNDIFLLAHRLVDHVPGESIGWYAVGVYNLSVGRYADAKRYFSRSSVVMLDRDFPPGWVGFGHAFAAQNEQESAINAYTTAARLYRGCHLPWVFLAMEYQRINDLNKCDTSLQLALSIAPTDHLALNELGIKCYRLNDLSAAQRHLSAALESVRQRKCHQAVHETILVNLATVYRKQGKLTEALELLSEALSIEPQSASTHMLIGMVKHELDDPEGAVTHYMASLTARPDHAPTERLLSFALSEVAMQSPVVPTRPTQEEEAEDMDMED